MKHTALALSLLALSGCMRSLRGPAEDHYVQAQTMADACRSPMSGPLSYPESPCSEDLQRNLDAAAKQADCIMRITRGEECAK